MCAGTYQSQYKYTGPGDQKAVSKIALHHGGGNYSIQEHSDRVVSRDDRPDSLTDSRQPWGSPARFALFPSDN